MRLSRTAVAGWLIGLTSVSLLGYSCAQDAPAKRDATQEGIVLQIAVCVESSPATLALILENHGKKDFIATDFGELGTIKNHIIDVAPSGAESHHVTSGPRERFTIKPGETKVWRLKLSETMRNLFFEEPGLHRVRWSVDGMESPEILLLVEEKKD